MKKPETSIRSVIRDYLRWHGYFVFVLYQSAISYPGLPDLIAIRNGRVRAIECKTPKGKLSLPQEKFKAAWESHGGEYIVARCIEDVK